MEKELAQKNIRLYVWFQTFKEPLFWGPVLIYFLGNVGHMSLPDIYFMEAFVMLGPAVLEIPTGRLADAIGRKKTIIIGSFLLLVDTVLFALVSGPVLAWIANIFWTIGFTLCSGADQALLYDTLARANHGTALRNEASKREGLAQGRRYLLFAATSLLAGYLAEIHPRLPLILSIPGMIGIFILSFFFSETEPIKKFEVKEQFGYMVQGVVTIFRIKPLLWIVCFLALVQTMGKAWFFSYNPFFEEVHLDLKFYGGLFCGINLLGYFCSRYCHDIQRAVGNNASLLFMVLSLGLPMFLMGFWENQWACLLIFFPGMGRGYIGPYFFGLTNQFYASENRATINSAKSSLIALCHAAVLFANGAVLEKVSLSGSLMIMGSATLAIGIILFVWHLRLNKE